MGGGGLSDSITLTNLLPTYIVGFQDWTIAYLDKANLLSVNNFTAYSGTTYAPQDSNELAGIAALVTRGTAGSPIESSGETYLRAMMNGTYLYANTRKNTLYSKHVEEIIQAFTEETLPNITNSFMFAFGGSDHQAEEAKAAEKVMAAINEFAYSTYYNDYIRERKAQDASLTHVPPYGNRAVRDAEVLRQAGVYEREYLQGYYSDNWKKWNEKQILPMRNLDILGNAIRSILGTTRTSSTQYYKPSTFVEIAGASLVGLDLYNMYKKSRLDGKEDATNKKSELIGTQKMTQNIINYYLMPNKLEEKGLDTGEIDKRIIDMEKTEMDAIYGINSNPLTEIPPGDNS